MAARDDAELVRRVLAGEREAFEPLLARHRSVAGVVARRLLGDREEAEDVVQDAALHAFLDLRRLRTPERFGAWFLAIVANLAKMRLRRRAARPVEDGGHAGPAAALDPSPEDAAELREYLRGLRAAIAELPPAQRQAVALFYLEGLSTDEVAAAVGRSPGAVRVGLHRARAQLRERLVGRRVTDIDDKEERAMVEVTVDDVLVRALMQEDALPKLVKERQRIVLLREKAGSRALPIWVGPAEGDALTLALGGESLPRPLTADLTAKLLEAAGAQIERVTVSRLEEKTFYATVSIAGGGRPAEVDARPSDAINLAVRVGAPIFVATEIMDASGLTGDVGAGLDRVLEEHGEAALEGDWQSLSTELVKALAEAK